MPFGSEPFAQEEEAAPASAEEPAGSPFDLLRAEYDAAIADWMARAEAAEGAEERDAVWADDPGAAFLPRFRELAEEHAGTDVALESWRFLLSMGARLHADAAFDALERDFLEREEMGDISMRLFLLTPRAEAFHQRLLTESPHHDVRGKACYSLGKLMNRRASFKEQIEAILAEQTESDPPIAPDATMRAIEGIDSATLRSEAEAFFIRVQDEFADVKVRRRSLADTAAGDLFELRNLQVGMIAPDIAGADVHGEEFRLSDYQGKVVVLDFWGDW